MKTILITGCSSGFGLETARYFLERDWKVIASMRTPREDVLPRSGGLRVLALDVTDPDSVRQAVESAGPIDVLVNNAGIGWLNALEGTPMDTARAIFETNTIGTMAVTQAVLPQFRQRKAGVVVNVSSSVTLTPLLCFPCTPPARRRGTRSPSHLRWSQPFHVRRGWCYRDGLRRPASVKTHGPGCRAAFPRRTPAWRRASSRGGRRSRRRSLGRWTSRKRCGVRRTTHPARSELLRAQMPWRWPRQAEPAIPPGRDWHESCCPLWAMRGPFLRQARPLRLRWLIAPRGCGRGTLRWRCPFRALGGGSRIGLRGPAPTAA